MQKSPHPDSTRYGETVGGGASLTTTSPAPDSEVANARFRGVLWGTMIFTGLQVLALFWFAKIPLTLTRNSSPIHSPRASSDWAPMTLAVGGLQESSSWLPDPRPFIVQPIGVSVSPKTPRPITSTPSHPQPARFLSFDATPAPVAPVIPPPLVEAQTIQIPRPPTPPTQRLALAQPELSITGPVQGRRMVRAIQIPEWTGSEPLGLTRVEISVNPDGAVVLTRVVESCGVRQADQLLVNACRSARFAASGPVAPGEEYVALTRGRVTLRWPSKP